MPRPSHHKIALLHATRSLKAKDLPKDVERYVQEGKDKGMDEDKAWAIAWSRYCKYKNPGSDHCKKDKSDYFAGRKAQGKTAASIDNVFKEFPNKYRRKSKDGKHEVLWMSGDWWVLEDLSTADLKKMWTALSWKPSGKTAMPKLRRR